MAIELLKSTPARIEALNWVINNRPPINLNPPPVQSKKQELLSSYSNAQQTQSQYNGMFKIIPIEQTETTMKIAVADGATWNPETQTSGYMTVATSGGTYQLDSKIYDIDRTKDNEIRLWYNGLEPKIVCTPDEYCGTFYILIGTVRANKSVVQVHTAGAINTADNFYHGDFAIYDISESLDNKKVKVMAGSTDIGSCAATEFPYPSDSLIYLNATYTDNAYHLELSETPGDACYKIGEVVLLDNKLSISQTWTSGVVYFGERFFIGLQQ